VTYWLDGNQTLKPSSKFNLGMVFNGDAASIMINLQGLFEDYSNNRYFLCQKQCRLKGKKVSFFSFENTILKQKNSSFIPEPFLKTVAFYLF
jgi:hypothetical protein